MFSFGTNDGIDQRIPDSMLDRSFSKLRATSPQSSVEFDGKFKTLRQIINTSSNPWQGFKDPHRTANSGGTDVYLTNDDDTGSRNCPATRDGLGALRCGWGWPRQTQYGGTPDGLWTFSNRFNYGTCCVNSYGGITGQSTIIKLEALFDRIGTLPHRPTYIWPSSFTSLHTGGQGGRPQLENW